MATKSDYSDYAKNEIRKSPTLKAKLLTRIKEQILQFEQLYNKRSAILRDYPETDLVFAWVLDQRKELEAMYEDLNR